jgi:hypothetical protein
MVTETTTMSNTENMEKLKDERIRSFLVCCHAMSHVSTHINMHFHLRHATSIVVTHSLVIPLGIPLPTTVSQTPKLHVIVES